MSKVPNQKLNSLSSPNAAYLKRKLGSKDSMQSECVSHATHGEVGLPASQLEQVDVNATGEANGVALHRSPSANSKQSRTGGVSKISRLSSISAAAAVVSQSSRAVYAKASKSTIPKTWRHSNVSNSSQLSRNSNKQGTVEVRREAKEKEKEKRKSKNKLSLNYRSMSFRSGRSLRSSRAMKGFSELKKTMSQKNMKRASKKFKRANPMLASLSTMRPLRSKPKQQKKVKIQSEKAGSTSENDESVVQDKQHPLEEMKDLPEKISIIQKAKKLQTSIQLSRRSFSMKSMKASKSRFSKISRIFSLNGSEADRNANLDRYWVVPSTDVLFPNATTFGEEAQANEKVSYQLRAVDLAFMWRPNIPVVLRFSCALEPEGLLYGLQKAVDLFPIVCGRIAVLKASSGMSEEDLEFMAELAMSAEKQAAALKEAEQRAGYRLFSVVDLKNKASNKSLSSKSTVGILFDVEFTDKDLDSTPVSRFFAKRSSYDYRKEPLIRAKLTISRPKKMEENSEEPDASSTNGSMGQSVLAVEFAHVLGDGDALNRFMQAWSYYTNEYLGTTSSLELEPEVCTTRFLVSMFLLLIPFLCKCRSLS